MNPLRRSDGSKTAAIDKHCPNEQTILIATSGTRNSRILGFFPAK
jgi:hypothetical protein